MVFTVVGPRKRDLRVSLSDVHCNIYTSSQASHNLLPYLDTPILYILNIRPKVWLASVNIKYTIIDRGNYVLVQLMFLLAYCKYRDDKAQKKSMKSINGATDLSNN